MESLVSEEKTPVEPDKEEGVKPTPDSNEPLPSTGMASNYSVIIASILSIALGLVLFYTKRKKEHA